MKTILMISIWLAGAVNASAQYTLANLRLEHSTEEQDRYRYQHLQLYPIKANQAFRTFHKGTTNYLTLKEALEKRKVRVTEQSDGGDVNTLYIENVSPDTIMILSGEVVKGGKQDRVIAQDFLLYPGGGRKDVSVFCVEHGRWNGTSSFGEYFSISSNEVRKAATVKKDQGEVWKKVAETTQKNQAGTSTGTLTALKNSQSFNAEIKKYTDHFHALLAKDPDVIGVIAVSGSTILGCDMFASHKIFTAYLPGLLNSYATEAITTGGTVTVTPEQVQVYLESIISDERKQDREIERKGTMLKDGDKKIHISTF